jgi:hypothetical protein
VFLSFFCPTSTRLRICPIRSGRVVAVAARTLRRPSPSVRCIERQARWFERLYGPCESDEPKFVVHALRCTSLREVQGFGRDDDGEHDGGLRRAVCARATLTHNLESARIDRPVAKRRASHPLPQALQFVFFSPSGMPALRAPSTKRCTCALKVGSSLQWS